LIYFSKAVLSLPS